MKFETIWNAYDIRNACIKNDWFTCGDCEEYDEMLTYVTSHDCTPYAIKVVATNIASHSDYNEHYCTFDEFVANIAHIIINDYCTHFVRF